MSRICRALILSVWITGCAPAASVPATAPQSGPTASVATLPTQIGQFRLTETHKYPEATAGTLYRYRSESALRPDVYVFPVNPGPGGVVPDNPARAEGQYFIAALDVQRQRGSFDAFEILSQSAVEHSGPPRLQGWRVYAILHQRGARSESYQHVYRVGDQLVKIRATFPDNSVSRDELESFIRDLLVAISN